MDCPNCQQKGLPGTAVFCVNCGQRLKPAAQKPANAPPARSETRLEVTQNLAGAQVSNAVGYEIKEIRGDVKIEGPAVFQLPKDFDLKSLAAIATELAPGSAAGIAGGKLPEKIEENNAKLDAVLARLREMDQQGRRAGAVSAGGTQISRVDLLLKKAKLLKIEAEQMALDHARKYKGRVKPGPGQTDLGVIFAGFDDNAYEAKLKQAHDLLQEARGLDPTNTEVLLNLAQILTQVTPDDPSDEEKVLYEVQSLLSNPKDKTEEFRLAQATFLLATAADPMHVDSLRDARDMFDRLGRVEWVRHCDDILRSAGGDSSGSAPAQPAGTGWGGMGAGGTGSGYGGTGTGWGQPGQMPMPQQPGMGQPGRMAQQQFQPAGNWNMQVMDAVQSRMALALMPNGQFQCTQSVPLLGMSVQAAGQWAYNPVAQMLQLQGTIGGFQPFMLAITIQGWNGAGWFGAGTDGIAYVLTPA